MKSIRPLDGQDKLFKSEIGVVSNPNCLLTDNFSFQRTFYREVSKRDDVAWWNLIISVIDDPLVPFCGFISWVETIMFYNMNMSFKLIFFLPSECMYGFKKKKTHSFIAIYTIQIQFSATVLKSVLSNFRKTSG